LVLLHFCRRDAYTVIAPDEEKRKILQESKTNCLASSLYSEHPNHIMLPFLITKWTVSNPNSFLSSALFFSSFKVNPHFYLIILISFHL